MNSPSLVGRVHSHLPHCQTNKCQSIMVILATSEPAGSTISWERNRERKERVEEEKKTAPESDLGDRRSQKDT